jgi:GGDEF domain-containing protein
LTNANQSEAELILERLDQIRTDFNQKANRGYDILCSVGMIAFDPQQHQSVEDLLQDGDRLMYAQKQSKRTKVL